MDSSADGGVISLLATSSDGLDWESDYTWVWQAQNLAYDGVRYGVVGRRTLEFSEDLSSRFWASPRDSMPVEKVEVLLETEDELIAVGTHEYGGNHDMPNSYLGVSADGVEWQWESVGCWVEDAAAHGGVVVFSCCCEQSLRVNDGGNWSLSNEFEGFPKLLAAGDPGFVFAIDDDVGYPPEDRRLFFSPDGFQWSSIGDVPFEHIDTLDWVNGNFVVCAGDGLGLSADGTNWEFFEIPGFGYTRSLSGDGRRLVRSVGSAGIKFSDDGGRTWSVATVPEGPRFNDLSWADGHFVAVGFSGTVAFSRDGEIWHRESVPWPLYLSQVVFRDGRYIVGGNSALLLGDPGPAPRHSGGRRGH